MRSGPGAPRTREVPAEGKPVLARLRSQLCISEKCRHCQARSLYMSAARPCGNMGASVSPRRVHFSSCHLETDLWLSCLIHLGRQPSSPGPPGQDIRTASSHWLPSSGCQRCRGQHPSSPRGRSELGPTALEKGAVSWILHPSTTTQYELK